MRERESLIARIRQVSRRATAAGRPSTRPTGDPTDDRLQALETRMAHLEQLIEGLQDCVHRESERHDKLIGELQVETRPGAISAALAEDARNRGL